MAKPATDPIQVHEQKILTLSISTFRIFIVLLRQRDQCAGRVLLQTEKIVARGGRAEGLADASAKRYDRLILCTNKS